MSAYNLVRSGRNFTQFFFNAELIVFDNAVYRLSISLSIPEIFAVKFESCRKSHRFLHVFALQNFKGGGAPKSFTCFNTAT